MQNNYINYLFVSFCILIIINGSNFIDGMNTLCVGYYLLISSIILYLQLNEIIIIKNLSIFYIFIWILFVFLLNLTNQLYLGDSGSYLLDAKHIHQLIFFYIKKKYNLNILLTNTLTSQMINFYNLIIFSIGLNFITYTIAQILLILFSIATYSLIYFKLFKFRYQKRV